MHAVTCNADMCERKVSTYPVIISSMHADLALLAFKLREGLSCGE